MDTPLMTPEQLHPATEAANRTLEQLDRILLGRHELHRLVLIGILARGHILLEGLPGLGKTALVKALGDIMQLSFKRVQFTPDLMPSDILGAHILQVTENGQREMVFQPGPVFCNLLLSDEINRASPKTQSAMLETMQERTVTLMGTTRPLPAPFFVLASQNPIELEGTYPLPEAQLDRFLFRLMVRDVDTHVLEEIITTRRHGTPPVPTWQLSPEDLEILFSAAASVVLPGPVASYVARIVAATHPGGPETPTKAEEYVTYGASPRAAIAIAESARAHALLDGRPTAGFDDVRVVTSAVLNHRLILNYKARFDQVTTFHVIDDLLNGLDPAGLDLPSDISVTGATQA